mmetsp:Transcript_50703/g.127204  ORF Transcript_50703/g.127204 Transcript_50703/m.127204 type:complete len:112 (-) Transcript_50703:87-422(-)
MSVGNLSVTCIASIHRRVTSIDCNDTHTHKTPASQTGEGRHTWMKDGCGKITHVGCPLKKGDKQTPNVGCLRVSVGCKYIPAAPTWPSHRHTTPQHTTQEYVLRHDVCREA